ncbi:hypothetical protein OAU50_07055 [Planctomycetota bacterium]|nr:hypothetical protein [Planctomycetota bacterium]
MPETAEDKSDASKLVSAKRVYWSGGLLFGLLLLMVLSGLSSITLLYDGIPSAEDLQGLEGAVLDTVRTLKPAIRFLHEYGGYAAMFLSGWLAIELIRFGKNARQHGQTADDKSTGFYIMLLGIPAAIGLVICLVLLIGTGIEARNYMDENPDAQSFDLPKAAKLEEFAKAQEVAVVESHTGMLTYVMAGVVILLVFSVQMTHKLALARKPKPERKDD